MNSSGSAEVAAVLWRQIKAITPFPGLMAVLIPAAILLTVGRGGGLEDLPPVVHGVVIGAGVLVLAFGLGMFCWTVTLFARRGQGTLAPFDAPRKLVVAGPYRHVRNPMYAGVFSILIGEVLVLQSWTILVWFGCFFTLITTLVPRREEPRLADQFGSAYAGYRAHVPRWLPRPTPWTPADDA